jgi:hypothetical protein
MSLSWTVMEMVMTVVPAAHRTRVMFMLTSCRSN